MGITAGSCANGCCGAASSDYRQKRRGGNQPWGMVFQPCRDITTLHASFRETVMQAVASILKSGNLGPVHPIGVRHAAKRVFRYA